MPPNVCRICLATRVRMTTIGGALQPVYEKLAGVALHTNQRPMVACYICHALLTKAQSLMLRAITAEKALQALLNVCAVITETSVSAVDRSAAGLCPSLSVSKLEYLDNIQLASGAEVKTENWNNQVNGVSENDLEEESISLSDSRTAGAVTSAAVAPNLDTEQPLNNHANGELEDSGGSEHNGSVSAAAASDVESESDGEAAGSSNNPRAEVEGSVSAAAASDVESESDGEAADCSINPRAEVEDMDAQVSEDTQALNQCGKCARGFDRACSMRLHLNAHAARSLLCQCRRQFKYRIQLQKHLSRCKRTQRVKCSVCQRLFPDKLLLDRHMGQHSSLNYQCDLCKKWCKTKEQLQKHLQIHRNHYCDLCQGQFVAKNILERHIREKHTSDPFRCNICQYLCHNRPGFQTHLKTHIDLRKCHICNQKFSSHIILEQHMSKHAVIKRILKTETYKCQECSREFSHKRILARHLVTHKDSNRVGVEKRNYEYKCNICPYHSNNSGNVKAHLKTHESQRVSCTVCKLRVSTKTALRYHMKLHKDTFYCSACQISFASRDAFQTHMDNHEPDEEETEPLKQKVDSNRVKKRYYLCHICPYRSTNSGHVKVHLKTHLVQKVACTVCELRVSSKSALFYHMKLHKDTFYCSACQISFASRDAFQTHMDNHEPDEEETEPLKQKVDSNRVKKRYYLCHICPYRSTNSGHVKVHLKTHLVQKVACTVCELRVSSKSALFYHMKLHKDTFYCSACQISFASRDAFQTHMADHEPDEEETEPLKQKVDSNRVKKRYYLCHICPYRSTNSGHVKVHLKTHLVQKVACTVCELRVSSKSALFYHMKLHKDTFYCSACQISFASRDAFQTHMADHEPDEEETERLKQNVDSNRVKKRYYLCHICPYRSTNSGNVTGHLKTHLVQKVACTVCELRVSSTRALVYHMKLHKDLEMHKTEPYDNSVKKRNFKCHICAYRSKHATCVRQHLKTHLVQKVACTVCNLRVSSKVALRYHMKLHKDSFYCIACQRSFACRDELQAHMAAHEPDEEETVEQVVATSGDKLQCSLCPRQFSLKIAFRRHVISEHL